MAGARAGLSKAAYLNLSNEDRKDFWLDKLDFILQDSNLDSIQRVTILALRTEIRNMETGVFEFTDAIRNLALDAVDVFSEADFLATFTSFDYNALSSNSTPTCSWCPGELNAPPIGSSTGLTPLPDCNCSWFCGDGCYSNGLFDFNDCCVPTMDGCGFLGLQSCDGYNE